MKKLWAAVLAGLLGCSAVSWAGDVILPGPLEPVPPPPQTAKPPTPYSVVPTMQPATSSKTTSLPLPATKVETKTTTTVQPAVVVPPTVETKKVVTAVPDLKAIDTLAGCGACSACAPCDCLPRRRCAPAVISTKACVTCTPCTPIVVAPKPCVPCTPCAPVAPKPCTPCTPCVAAPKPCTTCASSCGTCGRCGIGSGKLLEFFTYHQPLTPLGECGAEVRHAQVYTFFLDQPCRPTWKPVECCNSTCGSCGCGRVAPAPVAVPTAEVLPTPVPVTSPKH